MPSLNWIGGPVLSSVWWHVAIHRHSSTDSIVTFWKISWKPNYVPAETQHTYGQLSTDTQYKPNETQTPPNTMKHDQPQHDCVHYLCCHPAVFLCWLHLSILSFPKVKIQCIAKMLLLLHVVQDCSDLELQNLKQCSWGVSVRWGVWFCATSKSRSALVIKITNIGIHTFHCPSQSTVQQVLYRTFLLKFLLWYYGKAKVKLSLSLIKYRAITACGTAECSHMNS